MDDESGRHTKTHLLFIIQLIFSNISSMTIEGCEDAERERASEMK